jgi:hypothetical protein
MENSPTERSQVQSMFIRFAMGAEARRWVTVCVGTNNQQAVTKRDSDFNELCGCVGTQGSDTSNFLYLPLIYWCFHQHRETPRLDQWVYRFTRTLPTYLTPIRIKLSSTLTGVVCFLCVRNTLQRHGAGSKWIKGWYLYFRLFILACS